MQTFEVQYHRGGNWQVWKRVCYLPMALDNLKAMRTDAWMLNIATGARVLDEAGGVLAAVTF